jgi:endonuclease-3
MNAHNDLPFELPRVTSAQRQRARRLAALLAKHYPDAHCELNFRTPHELLVATILSAQTTDAAVNRATPSLFARFPTPADYAAAKPEDIEPYIRSLGFFRNKARAVHSAMTDVATRFNGQVPRTMEELLSLRGVARKTANVVLSTAYGINDGLAVDTHVERLAQRLCLAPGGSTVAMIERYLMALFPRDDWGITCHRLIWHGRRACKARMPACSDHPICREFGGCCELRKSPGRTKSSARDGGGVKKKTVPKKRSGRS